MTSMLRTSTVILLAVGAGIAGGFVGAFLGGRTDPQPTASRAGGTDAELLSAVHRMNSSLERLVEMSSSANRSADGPQLDTERHATASTEPGEAQQLQDSLASLSAAMRSLSEQLAKPTPPAQALQLEPRDVPDSVFTDLQAKDEARLKLEHFGWTPQMVLDAYGDPQDIGPSPSGGGAKWYYTRPGMKRIIFWFIDHRVASVLVL